MQLVQLLLIILKLQNLWCAKLTDHSEYGGGWDGVNGLYGQFGVPTGTNYALPSNGDEFDYISAKELTFMKFSPVQANCITKMIAEQIIKTQLMLVSQLLFLMILFLLLTPVLVVLVKF